MPSEEQKRPAVDDEFALRFGRAVLDALGLAVEALRNVERAPEFYSLKHPPPNFTWRATLEHARRGAFPITKRGKNIFVRREDHETWLSEGTTQRPARLRVVKAGDAATLETLGVRLAGARR